MSTIGRRTQLARVEDIKSRIKEFRAGMDAITQKTGISLESRMEYQHAAVVAGVVLIDLKYRDEELTSEARKAILQELQDEKGKKPDVTQEEKPLEVTEEQMKEVLSDPKPE